VVLGWLAGASVPPLVVLLLDPACAPAGPFVDTLFGLADPLFGLALTAPEFAVAAYAAVETAGAALGTFAPPTSDPLAAAAREASCKLGGDAAAVGAAVPPVPPAEEAFE
jgi:hypothetical protein